MLRISGLSLTFAFLVLMGNACSEGRNASGSSDETTSIETLVFPSFNADSAYAFIEAQVAFGPRVPNTPGHRACGDWLTKKLQRYADTVYVQQTKLRAFDGTLLDIRNIIGVFQPEKKKRVLLCAHWDTRPFADYDPNPDNHWKPIPGANDGASGVGVLLEIARLLHLQAPQVGIDIVFFDAEDYGTHSSLVADHPDTWALGSQFWAQSPHRPDYFAQYGILLDMVGAANATFKQEGFSMYYAPNIVRKVWRKAQNLGYGQFFLTREGAYITDDHYYVNKIRNIPTINIIHLEPGSLGHGFFEHWHTLRDDMSNIDRNTLMAVGHTLSAVIYSEQ